MSFSSSFPRTRALIDADRAKGWIFLRAFAFLVSLAWILWLVSSQVHIVESATQARLEAMDYVHKVESSAGGRVTLMPAQLGQWVEAGDLLLELETEHQVHGLEEARGRQVAWREKLEALEAARTGHARMVERERELTDRQLEEIAAKREVELVTLEYAEKRVRRSEKLFELGLVSEVDLLHQQGDAEKAEAEARVRLAESKALAAKSRRDATEHATEITETERDISEAQGELAALEAQIELLLHEIEDRQVRAPISGRLGWLAPLKSGAVAEVGERIAEIVPGQSLRVIAFFPRSAIGLIEVGQRAQLRLHALPWTRYGTLPLVVERLGSEVEGDETSAPKDGVKVELALAEESDLPVIHGMTGELDIMVDEVSPARWLLDAVGRATAQDRGAE